MKREPRRDNLSVNLQGMGRLLKACRELLRFSLRDLSKLSGMSPAQIMRMESGEFDYSILRFTRLASALGLSPGMVIDCAVRWEDDAAMINADVKELQTLVQKAFPRERSTEPECTACLLLNDLCRVVFRLVLASNPVLLASRCGLPALAGLREQLRQFAATIDPEMTPVERLAFIHSIADRPYHKLKSSGLVTDDMIVEFVKQYDRTGGLAWPADQSLDSLASRSTFLNNMVKRLDRLKK